MHVLQLYNEWGIMFQKNRKFRIMTDIIFITTYESARIKLAQIQFFKQEFDAFQFLMWLSERSVKCNALATSIMKTFQSFYIIQFWRATLWESCVVFSFKPSSNTHAATEQSVRCKFLTLIHQCSDENLPCEIFILMLPCSTSQ